MAEPKYDFEIDLSNPNTSHALMLEMIGDNKRVLEVGCATGYMSRLLRDRGCAVVGIERDGEAALKAKEFCEDVVVADVEEVDFHERFGPARFDVVVFGDVLEHLRDPLGTLRGANKVLALGGFVVASLPNVSHGSVRLSLLQGRFEYRSLGLLDDTHLKFFTMASIEQLFRNAGLVVVETRRTTEGIFNTEIPLNRDDFPEEVLRLIESDPEATTYQFVVKAVLDDGLQAIRELHEREEQQRGEILHLDEQVEKLQSELSRLAEHEDRASDLSRRLAESEQALASAETRLRLAEERWARLERRLVVRLLRMLQRFRRRITRADGPVR